MATARHAICSVPRTAPASTTLLRFPGDFTFNTFKQTHQNELIWNLTKAGAGNKTIVVGSSTGTVLLPWKDAVAGIILNFMPGQYYGDALANVLYGDVPFSGKLPVSKVKLPAYKSQNSRLQTARSAELCGQHADAGCK